MSILEKSVSKETFKDNIQKSLELTIKGSKVLILRLKGKN